jgi:hypothetical protein
MKNTVIAIFLAALSAGAAAENGGVIKGQIAKSGSISTDGSMFLYDRDGKAKCWGRDRNFSCSDDVRKTTDAEGSVRIESDNGISATILSEKAEARFINEKTWWTIDQKSQLIE